MACRAASVGPGTGITAGAGLVAASTAPITDEITAAGETGGELAGADGTDSGARGVDAGGATAGGVAGVAAGGIAGAAAEDAASAWSTAG